MMFWNLDGNMININKHPKFIKVQVVSRPHPPWWGQSRRFAVGGHPSDSSWVHQWTNPSNGQNCGLILTKFHHANIHFPAWTFAWSKGSNMFFAVTVCTSHQNWDDQNVLNQNDKHQAVCNPNQPTNHRLRWDLRRDARGRQRRRRPGPGQSPLRGAAEGRSSCAVIWKWDESPDPRSTNVSYIFIYDKITQNIYIMIILSSRSKDTKSDKVEFFGNKLIKRYVSKSWVSKSRGATTLQVDHWCWAFACLKTEPQIFKRLRGWKESRRWLSEIFGSQKWLVFGLLLFFGHYSMCFCEIHAFWEDVNTRIEGKQLWFVFT